MTRGHDGYDFLSAESLAKQRAREVPASLPGRPPVADNDQVEELARIIAYALSDTIRWDDLASWYQDDCRAEARAVLAAGWRKTEGA